MQYMCDVKKIKYEMFLYVTFISTSMHICDATQTVTLILCQGSLDFSPVICPSPSLHSCCQVTTALAGNTVQRS